MCEQLIVFTLGSAAAGVAGDFFEQSADAARRLGRRAVLLVGRDPRNQPKRPLPPRVIAVPYAPHAAVFPRASVIVHQGGVGTTGEAMRAGCLMLVVPYSHDQPDHAARLTRLGLARSVRQDHYNSSIAAREIHTLLRHRGYADRAAEIGSRIRCENGVATACDRLGRPLVQSSLEKQNSHWEEQNRMQMLAHRIHRPAILLLVAMTLTLVTMSSLAKTQPTCPAEGNNSVDWTVVHKSTDNYVCVKPGVDWTRYTRFQLEPSSFAPADKREALKEEDERKVTTFFDAKLQASFNDQQTEDGPSLRIKPTITAVRRSRSALNAIGIMLIRIPLSYGGATVRFNLIDNDTGETVGIVTSSKRERRWNGFQGLRALGHSRVVLNGSAKRIKHDTDLLWKSTETVQLSNLKGGQFCVVRV